MTILGLDANEEAQLAGALRALFNGANYTLEHVAQLLSPAANAALARLHPYAARRELAAFEPALLDLTAKAEHAERVERANQARDHQHIPGATDFATAMAYRPVNVQNREDKGTDAARDAACAALARLFLLGQALPELAARAALNFVDGQTWDLAVGSGLLVPGSGTNAEPHRQENPANTAPANALAPQNHSEHHQQETETLWEAAFSITPHTVETVELAAHSGVGPKREPAARQIGTNPASCASAAHSTDTANTAMNPLQWWIASDHGHLARPARAGLPPQWVGGIGGATTSLLTFMERTAVDSALDLGTGCGIVALHATLFARHVTATDILPRALDFARFNAHLCAVSLATGPAGDGLWLAQGSLFEPVAGRRFDLIVSNPPFVITPPRYRDPAGQRLVYRDAGLGADRLVETVLRQAGQFLHPGGSLQCLLNWEQYGPAQAQVGQANPAERVVQWLAGTGLHGVLFWRETQDSCQYAEVWLRDEGLRPGPDFAFEAAYLAYLQDFSARGVQAVQLGYLFARRTPQADAGQLTWVDARHAPAPRAGVGREILDTAGGRLEFTAQDRIHLLVGARDLAQVRHYPLGAEQPAWQGLAAARGGESWETRSASALTLGALSVADQPLTVGQIANILADLLDIETAAATEQLIAELNALTRQGLLLPTSAR